MSLSLGERLLVPGLGVALFSAMAWGFMGAVGGSTRRMKTVLLCAILFMTGFGYSVFWQDKLAWLFGWTGAWKAIVAAFAVGSIYLCRRILLKQAADANAQRE